MIYCFGGIVDQALFPAGSIVRDSHHRKSSTYLEQDKNLCRTGVQALSNEVVLKCNRYTIFPLHNH